MNLSYNDMLTLNVKENILSDVFNMIILCNNYLIYSMIFLLTIQYTNIMVVYYFKIITNYLYIQQNTHPNITAAIFIILVGGSAATLQELGHRLVRLTQDLCQIRY